MVALTLLLIAKFDIPDDIVVEGTSPPVNPSVSVPDTVKDAVELAD